MAKPKQGLLGAFNGKLGNMIGGSVRGTNYLRLTPANVRNPKTPAQMRQRQRFGLTNSLLRHFQSFIPEGFKNALGNQSPYNRAVSYNAKNAFEGEYPNQQIAFSQVRVSEGDLSRIHNPIVDTSVAGELSVTWTPNSTEGSASETDVLMLLVFCPELEDSQVVLRGPERASGSHSIALPGTYSNKTLHVWASFQSADGKKVATSTYAGVHTAA